jgi:hypothetical protein
MKKVGVLSEEEGSQSFERSIKRKRKSALKLK